MAKGKSGKPQAKSGQGGKKTAGSQKAKGGAKPSKPAAAAKPAKAAKTNGKTAPAAAAKGKKAAAAEKTARPKEAPKPPTAGRDGPSAAVETASGGVKAVKLPGPPVARTPERAEELKQKLGALASSVSRIRELKRTLPRSFYDIGQILQDIKNRRLYEVKGYGSFEAFVEREIDLGKQMSLRIVRIVQTFLRDAALAAGLERVTAALAALEGEEGTEPTGETSAPSASERRPVIPPHKL